jgi:two-component system NtrC family response regulator
MAEGRVIEPADLELAPEIGGLLDLDIRAARMRAEREVIQLALSQGNGVIATAAKLLGVSRPTLYGLLQEHGIGPALELAREQEGAPSSNEKPIG